MKSEIEQFEDLLEMKSQGRDEYRRRRSELEEKWKQDLEGLHKQLFPRKRKYRFSNIRDTDEFHDLSRRWRSYAQGVLGRLTLEEKQIEHALEILAPQIELQASEEPTLAGVEKSGYYRSQGFGANKYARAAARNTALHFERQGLRVEIRLVEQEPFKAFGGVTSRPVNYEVWVWLSPTMLEVADRQPSLSLRDWMMSCWGQSVNPRVLNPFLPVGLEERLEIDYFGNDLREKREARERVEEGQHA